MHLCTLGLEGLNEFRKGDGVEPRYMDFKDRVQKQLVLADLMALGAASGDAGHALKEVESNAHLMGYEGAAKLA